MVITTQPETALSEAADAALQTDDAGLQPLIPPDALPADATDAPLIAPDGVTETESPAAEQFGATPTPEAGEAAAEETPPAEPEAEASVPEGPTLESLAADVQRLTGENERFVNENRALQSSNDRAQAQARQERAQLEQQFAERDVLGRAETYKARQRDGYIAQGYVEEHAERQAESDKQTALAEYGKQQNDAQSLQYRKGAIAMALAKDYDLEATDLPALMNLNSQDEMQAHAQVLKDRKATTSAQTKELEDLRAENARLKQAQVPAGGPQQQLDSGGGAGGALTDDQVLARFTNPDDSFDDFAAVQKILTARGL